MGKPAIVQGDMIIGACAHHMIPGPLGAPIPTPPMPFVAPLMQALEMTVMITGKPAAVVGSAGMNTPAHVGLHGSDPFLAPLVQRGVILGGSPTVFFGGKPAASSVPPPKMCLQPGQVMGSAVTVLVG